MANSRSCLYCDKRFEIVHTRRLFCSDKCKTRYHREEKNACFYCGELATDRDHLLPASLDASGRVQNGRDTVLSCRECNSILNNYAPLSVEARIIHLRDKLRKKYKLHKRMPEWDDDELQEMGNGLLSHIQSKVLERQRAMQRVENVSATLRLVKSAKY